MKRKIWIAYGIVVVLMVIAIALGIIVCLTSDDDKINSSYVQGNNLTATDDAKTDTTLATDELEPTNEPAATITPKETNEPAATITPIETSEPVKIIFTGDVYLPEYLQKSYKANGISGIMTSNLRKILVNADILMINNEFPFSKRGTKQNKQFTFRLDPSFVSVLTDIGVDIASLANNHCQDYGKQALSDTFATLENVGIKYAGAGESVDRAKEIQIMTVNGKKYGFIAASRVVPDVEWRVEKSAPGVFSCYDDKELVELVTQAKKECDYVAVFPHWGVERKSYPEKYQSQIAKDCIEAGADAVVGAHSHCLQGIEYFDGKPVFYSLGNFIFRYDIDMSAVLEVLIEPDGSVVYKMVPVYTKNGVTDIATDKKADEIIAHLNSISDNADIAQNGIVSNISK